MAAGLIMARGPPGARLAIGICRDAQGELKGPITPRTLRSAAYARAFGPQRAQKSAADVYPAL